MSALVEKLAPTFDAPLSTWLGKNKETADLIGGVPAATREEGHLWDVRDGDDASLKYEFKRTKSGQPWFDISRVQQAAERDENVMFIIQLYNDQELGAAACLPAGDVYRLLGNVTDLLGAWSVSQARLPVIVGGVQLHRQHRNIHSTIRFNDLLLACGRRATELGFSGRGSMMIRRSWTDLLPTELLTDAVGWMYDPDLSRRWARL